MEISPIYIEIANSIDMLKPAILSTWARLVREQITSSEEENILILEDHLPEILDQISNVLRSGSTDDFELGKAHGFQRAVLTDYSISELMKEIAILRGVLVDYLYPVGDVECTKLLHGYLDIFCKNSVLEFVNSIKLVHKSQDRIFEEPPVSESRELQQMLDENSGLTPN
jgi:hypothetical protein